MPADMIEQLVILQERLAHCDGSLRICGLSPNASKRSATASSTRPCRTYATRQEAVLGGDATALHEKLQEMLSSSVSGDQMQAAAAFARHQPSRQ